MKEKHKVTRKDKVKMQEIIEQLQDVKEEYAEEYGKMLLDLEQLKEEQLLKISKLLEGLNTEQKLAVLFKDGGVRVVSCAGTGKTTVLTKRLATLVLQGVQPNRILSLTFTNKAAKEMKTRAEKLIGKDTEGKNPNLNLYTFHSFCNIVLTRYSELIGLKKYQIISNEKAMIEAINDIIEAEGLEEEMKKFEAKEKQSKGKYAYTKKQMVNDILERLEEYKTKETDKYINFFLKGTHIEELPSFQTLKSYKTVKELESKGYPIKYPYMGVADPYLYWAKELIVQLKANEKLTFDDLIIFTLHIMSEYEECLREIQGAYDYIQVDEFQDTDEKQMRIVELLIENSHNLFVVGDPDQSIYSFRHTTPQILIDLDKRIEGLQTIVLNRNYRSVPEILDAGNKVIKLNKNRIDKELVGYRESSNDKVKLIRGYSLEDTTNLVIENIAKNIKEGYNYKDIAVIYRSNNSASKNQLIDLFKDNNIPYTLAKTHNTEALDFMSAICRACVDTTDVQAYKDTLKLLRGNIKNTKSVLLSLGHKAKKGTNCIEILQEMITENKIEMDTLKPLTLFLEFVKDWQNTEDNLENLPTRYFNWYVDEYSSIDHKSNAQKLYYDTLSELVTDLEDIIESINAKEKDKNNSKVIQQAINELYTYSESEEKTQNSISLLTIHKSKGMEFPIVYCLDVQKGTFPLEFGSVDAEEENRIAYVAYTRAKDRLYLSSSGGINTRGQDIIPSRVLLCLDYSNLDIIGNCEKNDWEKWKIGERL